MFSFWPPFSTWVSLEYPVCLLRSIWYSIKPNTWGSKSSKLYRFFASVHHHLSCCEPFHFHCTTLKNKIYTFSSPVFPDIYTFNSLFPISTIFSEPSHSFAAPPTVWLVFKLSRSHYLSHLSHRNPLVFTWNTHSTFVALYYCSDVSFSPIVWYLYDMFHQLKAMYVRLYRTFEMMCTMKRKYLHKKRREKK